MRETSSGNTTATADWTNETSARATTAGRRMHTVRGKSVCSLTRTATWRQSLQRAVRADTNCQTGTYPGTGTWNGWPPAVCVFQTNKLTDRPSLSVSAVGFTLCSLTHWPRSCQTFGQTLYKVHPFIVCAVLSIVTHSLVVIVRAQIRGS